jgi:hypothetical protein
MPGGKSMDIRSLTSALCVLLIFNINSASASVVFYNDSAAFNAVANTSIIDFEGRVADDGISPPADAVVINDIIFTTEPQQASARIFGKDIGDTDSALFVANNGNNIIIDMSNSGAGGVTAAGGIFGDYNGPAGQQVQFNIYDSLGIIDTQTVNFGDMRIGGDKTFFGWIAMGGDVITTIELLGDLGEDRILYSALDDFHYGAAVPIPAAVWLFGSGLLGLAAVARRRQ